MVFRIGKFFIAIACIILSMVLAYHPQAATLHDRPTIVHKRIYLTFDMDMNESMERKLVHKQVQRWYDPAVFDYLQRHNIQATFFVSGLFAKTYPDFLRSLSNNPNYSFQNHSYDESSFVPHCFWLRTIIGDQEKIFQIQKTQDILKKITGQTPTLFRYPGLCRDSRSDVLVKRLGFTISDGNLSAGDPFSNNAAAIEHKILKQARDESVIVMHVGGPNAPKSFEVLQIIVPRLQDEGFVFFKL